jgi:hypothetical protein
MSTTVGLVVNTPARGPAMNKTRSTRLAETQRRTDFVCATNNEYLGGPGIVPTTETSGGRSVNRG